ncbi:MAG: histidine kinase [Spirochaetales bacterium]|jgi:sensor histidine kinase YesM
MILNTVRGKIISHSVLILVIMMLATLYTGLTTFNLADSVSVLFSNNLVLKDLRESLAQTDANLTGYLTSKSSDALKDYIRNSTHLSEISRKLNRDIRNDESLLLQRDLARVVEYYLTETEACVAAKRGRDVQTYSATYDESRQSVDLIRYLAEQTERVFIADSLTAFSGFRSGVPATVATNAILVIAASLFSFMLMIQYSYTLTEPITILANAARAVGRGESDAILPPPGRADEMGVMATAFSTMRENVRKAFDELKSKAEVEKNLMEERMVVLDMEHRLKDAELMALQSQINPHFLYNTLSAGMGIAWSEKADKTSKFLEDLAAFIRYSLKPTFRTVRVAEEIECARRYISLIQARFGERYRFAIEVEDETLDVQTPALLLQPLIENAITHGLGKKEEGGDVRIMVRATSDETILSVSDNGDGMSPEEIARVLGEDSHEEAASKRGIGLMNVKRRVILSTNGEGDIEIESAPKGGTTVSIHLPRKG